jgi:hypothetical protein
VLVKTFRRCIGLGVLLALGTGPAWSKDPPVVGVAVSISVYDDARVGPEMVAQAEEIAAYVFHRAGIEVHWLNCDGTEQGSQIADSCGLAVFPTNLQLRIVRRPRALKPDTAGIAYLSDGGFGCYSEVFVQPVEELRHTYAASASSMLGYAAAHEIAHLLLGTNSHSVRGIMRARWLPQDIVNAQMGRLFFDSAQGEAMRKRLSGGVSAGGEPASLLAAAPTGR